MQVNTSTTFKIRAVGLMLVVGCSTTMYSEQQRPSPPKELIQYIQDARGLGLSETQIHANAVRAGWPVAVVDQSIAQVRNSTSVESSTPTTPTSAGTRASIADGEPPTSNNTSVTPDLPPSLPGDYHIGAGDVL